MPAWWARSFPRLAIATALATATAGFAGAQSSSSPIFQLQPALATADFISVPHGSQSTTAFLVRFATRFPTGLRWLTPVIGASFTPYGSTGFGPRNTDAPSVFVGNVFPVVSSGASGWFTLEIPLLLIHAPGASRSGSARDYGRDAVVQPTVYIHVGSRMLRELGPVWSRLELFGMIEQNLTPNRNESTGTRDRFNPVVAAGASLGFGGAGVGR